MARQSSSPSRGPIKLTRSCEDAAELLTARIDIGRTLIEVLSGTTTADKLEPVQSDYDAWNDYNAELLKQLFTTDAMNHEYSLRGIEVIGTEAPFVQEEINNLQKQLKEKIKRLSSIKGRLPLLLEPAMNSTSVAADTTGAGAPTPSVSNKGKRVFVVYGHDRAARDAVTNLIRKVELDPIVIAEEPTGGRTIIEAVEHYGKADFAVVLFTPDDKGGTNGASPDNLRPRARQNVVLEYGYFVAALGRPNVCALCKEDVELPSDINGLLYIVMDPSDAWLVKLAREMRSAGLPVVTEALI